jgi:hypothetical protein
LAHLPDNRRKKIWRFLLALPPFLAEKAFQSWWGMASWKKIFRPLWHLLRVEKNA